MHSIPVAHARVARRAEAVVGRKGTSCMTIGIAPDKGKMVTDGLSTGRQEAETRKRLKLAGYSVPVDEPLHIVHCGKEQHSWLSNGFTQCFADVDGQRCRILNFVPGQSLQSHTHDADELFIVRGGSVKVFKWATDTCSTTTALPFEPCSVTWVPTGRVLEIPRGTPHALFASLENGVQFHEVVGNFKTRSTTFLSDVARESKAEGWHVLGTDGELRLVTAVL